MKVAYGTWVIPVSFIVDSSFKYSEYSYFYLRYYGNFTWEVKSWVKAEDINFEI